MITTKHVINAELLVVLFILFEVFRNFLEY